MKKGEQMPEHIKEKIRLTRSGQGNFRIGKKHSAETIQKMRESGGRAKGTKIIGRKVRPEFLKSMSEAQKKRFSIKENHPMYGRTHTMESRSKMVASHTGKVLSKETCRKLSEAHKGSKHWNWQGGVTSENKKIRSSAKWKEWRKMVFERDNYVCQECFATNCLLEPHHIIPIRSDKNKLFSTKNGITLCRPCHQKTIWKEHLYRDKYSLLTCS